MTIQETPTPAVISRKKVAKGASLTPSEQNPQSIPLEVWQRICDYLYPSQLVRLSKVSSLTHHVVCGLSVWSKIFSLTHGPNSRLHLLPRIPESQSYMLYMVAISPKVCEQCFKMCSIETDRSSTFPLPTVAPSQTRSTKDITYHGEPIDKNFKVCLCVKCRRAYYEVKPEPIPLDMFERRTTYGTIAEKYPHISEALPVPSRASTQLVNLICNELTYFKAARVLHGGDAGIDAARMTATLQHNMTNLRLEEYESQSLYL